MNINEIYRKTSELSKDLARNVKTYLAGLTIASSVFAGTLSYNHEIERTKKIPLGFSEKTQIEMQAESQGKEVDSATRYLTSLNDSCMKIFEAWNDSWINRLGFEGNPYEVFAANLEYKFGSEDHHYMLVALLENLPIEIEKVAEELDGFAKIRQPLSITSSYFKNSWNDNHNDIYHTEVYFNEETYTDLEGNLKTEHVMKTREVYDYTIHTYNYNPSEGEKAEISLEKLISENPNLAVNFEFQTAFKTNLEGKRAALESRVKNPEKEDFLDSEYLLIANRWKLGSVLFNNRTSLTHPFETLKVDLVDWKTSRQTARSQEYRTYSSSDAGPKEFRDTEKALQDCSKLSNSLDEIFNSLSYAEVNIPKIQDRIMELIKMKNKGDKKELETFSNKLIDETIKLYQSNFNNGFDVDRFRTGMILLWTFSGLTFGLGASSGIFLLKNKYEK